jgi:uncharacterized protein (DUF2252 family)
MPTVQQTETRAARLSPAEREQLGKEARAKCPRSSHAIFEPAAKRPNPVKLLEGQAKSRVQDLVPIRYGRMLVSPFTFYRGAALIMTNDLSGTPSSGFTVQCCGDAHLSNFGVFASPERKLIFDINDFDETHAGPWEWDVKRLAASMAIAAQDREFPLKVQAQVVLDTVGSYRNAISQFAGMSNLEVWYAHLDIEALMGEVADQFKPKMVKRTEKGIAKARTRDSMQAFSKLTETVDGQARIAPSPPLIVPIDAIAEAEDMSREEVIEQLRSWLRIYHDSLPYDRRVLLDQFHLVDFARKVVGVGSVGTRCWIALMFGRDQEDPLFLQIKEAEASVMEGFLTRSVFSNQGERVVVGQRIMQATSDIFLGWLRIPAGLDGQARDFYVRQLRDWKGSAEIEQMAPAGMSAYGRLCGWTLARAHARSGDRIAIASYLGGGPSFERAIVDFSEAYAEQNKRDYDALARAAKTGRIHVQTGL